MAQSGFTFADLYWTTDAEQISSAEQARMSVERALRCSPHRSDVWLLLAALVAKLHWVGLTTSAALKMSYYTGPELEDLIPLRLLLAAQVDPAKDPELGDLVRQDIRTIVNRKPELKSAIVAAYRAAPAPDRRIIDETVTDLDPSLANSLRETAK